MSAAFSLLCPNSPLKVTGTYTFIYLHLLSNLFFCLFFSAVPVTQSTQFYSAVPVTYVYLCLPMFIVAWAAANRANGTRYGEQLT